MARIILREGLDAREGKGALKKGKRPPNHRLKLEARLFLAGPLQLTLSVRLQEKGKHTCQSS